MEINDSRVPDDLFGEFLDRMPQVCVELVVETAAGILVCKRETKPRVWFWPGSRLYKGERLDGAAHRVAADELGIDIRPRERLGVHTHTGGCKFVKIFDPAWGRNASVFYSHQYHFWDETETPEGVSRHTVNIVFLAAPAADEFEIELDEQHSEYRFLTETEPGLHEYVREYIDTYGLVEAS